MTWDISWTIALGGGKAVHLASTAPFELVNGFKLRLRRDSRRGSTWFPALHSGCLLSWLVPFMPQVSISRIAILLGILAAVFFYQLGAAKLWDRDEPRNSRASHEMLERGDWVVPTFNGQLRAHKPILLYWGQMASYIAFGESEFSARLPSALCALITCLTLAWLTSRLGGNPTGISAQGFWAAAVMGTCMLFVMAGRAATPDACLIAFSTLGIASLVVGSLKSKPPFSSGRVGSTKWTLAILGYAMLGIAVLAKGPVGFVLPMAVVALWWLVVDGTEHRTAHHDGRSAAERSRAQAAMRNAWHYFGPWRLLRAAMALRLIPGVITVLAVAVPWYYAVGVETDGAFLRGFFWEHNVGRAMNSMEGHRGSVLFYPAAFLAGTFPWSLWLIPIFLWARSSARQSAVSFQLTTLSLIWIGVYIGAFSLASTKLPSYITPCYGGFAVLAGGYLRDFETRWSMPSISWRRLAYAITLLVGCGMTVAFAWAGFQDRLAVLAPAVPAGIAICSLAAVALVLDQAGKVQWIPAAWLAGAAAFQVLLFGVGAGSASEFRRDLESLIALRQKMPNHDWVALGGIEPSWIHYLDTPIVEFEDDLLRTQDGQSLSQFMEAHPNALLVVSGEAAHASVQQGLAQDLELEPVVEVSRFLKSGNVSVFRRAARLRAALGTGVQAESAPDAAGLRR